MNNNLTVIELKHPFNGLHITDAIPLNHTAKLKGLFKGQSCIWTLHVFNLKIKKSK